MKILSKKDLENGSCLVLVKYTDYFYAFGNARYINSSYGSPVNQCGTKRKVIEQLKSWKKIDFDNPRMLKIENSFIRTLENEHD